MNKESFSYCVVIRTLGLAGVMYQKELDSLLIQTIPPKKIIIYIAEGYDKPKESIGIEEYVYVKKGMVAQRALPLTEVDTDYVLMLDDDLYLPPDCAEKLHNGLISMDGDCIAADIFENHQMSITSKIRAFMTNFVYPRSDDAWAFKINKTSSFSYNNNPTKDVYLSQSAAGAASFWRTASFRKIHFEDELWLDNLGFAYGEDLLLFNKLVKNDGKLLIHYRTGIIHLDAGTGRKYYMSDPNRLTLRAMIHLVLWWRICYNLSSNTKIDKLIASLAYMLKFTQGLIIHLVYSLCKLSSKPLSSYITGHVKGWKYVHSETYTSVPNFILPKARSH